MTATESDKSAADQRNRAVFYENWKIVKALWTQDTVHIDGDFWKVPTSGISPRPTVGGNRRAGQDAEGNRIVRASAAPSAGVLPFQPEQETVRFWGREGARWWPYRRRQGGLHLIAQEST